MYVEGIVFNDVDGHRSFCDNSRIFFFKNLSVIPANDGIVNGVGYLNLLGRSCVIPTVFEIKAIPIYDFIVV